MKKTIVYFEAMCTKSNGEVVLEFFKCGDNKDYRIHIKDLKKQYSEIQVCFKKYSDGTTEDGELNE